MASLLLSDSVSAFSRQERQHCHQPGVRSIEIRLQDYRELDESFDRIWSIGMFEHVGVKNYGNYFEVTRRCLADDGLNLLHTIGGNESTNHTDPWIGKYIFPNSMIPSRTRLASS